MRSPHCFARLQEIIPKARDPRTLCDQAAEALQEAIGCRCVRFILPRDVSETADTPAVRWVQDHKRPRSEGLTLHWPLLSRGGMIGVLEITAQSEEQIGQWDDSLLEPIAVLVALALDNLQARERVAELERFQRESAYLRDEIKTERDLRLLTGDSPGMKAVRLAVQQVARQDSTVLSLARPARARS